MCKHILKHAVASTTPFMVPLGQNYRFVGCEAQLSELEGKLFVDGVTTRIAVTGPGGVGKTQLALALAYRVKQANPDCSVFWIPANDMESIQQAFTQMAQRLNILGWNEEKADLITLVKRHLCKEDIGQWLLIFDNADTATLEAAGSPNNLNWADYLPISTQGAIVFTTIHKQDADTLGLSHTLDMQRMNSETAREMFLKLIRPTTEHHTTNLDTQPRIEDPLHTVQVPDRCKLIEEEAASLILLKLAYLPLAIALAAAYIKENRVTITDYLALLTNQDKGAVEHISDGFDEEWQDHSAQHPVAATLLLSFSRLLNQHKSAADYLCFMVCLDRRDIPLMLLPSIGEDDKAKVDAVGILEAYSFLTRRPADCSLDMHRLVHLTICNWLELHGNMARQMQQAIKRLNEVFKPDREIDENMHKWRRLLPHAKHALSFRFTNREVRYRTRLLDKCAGVLYRDGRYSEAALYTEKALENVKTELGAEHRQTLRLMNDLAVMRRYQGRWKEAEDLGVKLLDTSRRVLGPEHQDTLRCMSNLAVLYRNQDRWKEAEALVVQVLDTSRRVLGPEHRHTLAYMNNLALSYSLQGRWDEAEAMQVQVLDTRKRVLGPEHPDTLASIRSLAVIYSYQGRSDEAKAMQDQVLGTRKRVLGQQQ